MLKLQSGKAQALPIPLPGGAVVRVRPATSFETDKAGYAAHKLLAGLVAGEDAAMMAAIILGPEFQVPDFTKPDWQQAAAQRVALLELACECIESWDGIVDENDQPLPVSREAIALLIRDTEIGARIRMAINSAVHVEVDEKNVSAASLDGAAAKDVSGARPAGIQATAAQ